MKAALITFAVMVFTTILMAQNRAAQTPPIKESGFRVSLVGGNELYAWCSTAQRTVNVQVDGVRFTGCRKISMQRRYAGVTLRA